MIFAEKLTKKFDDFTAVNNVSLSVNSGEVLILLGPNGAGKTTTVRMLTSILRPTSGSARVAGYDVTTEAEKVRANVGVLTEHHGLYARMNAVEYLEFFGNLYGLSRERIHDRMGRLLEEFGLNSVRKKRLGEYSKGMRQKLALVRALLHDPPVLIFDEPTSAMDPESARLVRSVIATLRSSDRTILLCTHNLAEAEALADRVAIIQQGRIIQQDTQLNLKRKLLGPPLFEARFARPFDGRLLNLPVDLQPAERGDNFLRFQIADPDRDNPRLLRLLLQEQEGLVSFQPVPTTLEQAYLAAVAQEGDHD